MQRRRNLHERAQTAAAPARPGSDFSDWGRTDVSGPDRTFRYEIRVEGALDDCWADWFGGIHLEREGTQTLLSGLLPDQPALHGLLARIRDLGLCLISVRRLDPDEEDTRAP